MWSRPTAVADTIAPGSAFYRFRIESVLGQGAMGVVYRATAPEGDVVALKVLKAELAGDETYRRRFLHEARTAREVRHPGLIPIVEAGEWEGQFYIAASYAAGGSLAELVAASSEGLPLERVRAVSDDVSGGLDALHEAGIVHRDVKPANIVLSRDGSAALTDFGLVKGRAYTVLTRPGQVVGTVDYLAPELIRGESPSVSTDVYALGCVVFECLTRSPPFVAKGFFQVALAHLNQDPPQLVERRASIPAAISAVVARAMAKEPSERPTSAGEFARELARANDESATRG